MSKLLFSYPEPVDLALDRGLHYGDGLFETLRVHAGRIAHWPYHWQRLQRGCAVLQLTPPDPEPLLQRLHKAVQHEQQAVLKIILSRGAWGAGNTGPQLLALQTAWPEQRIRQRQHGVPLQDCPHPLPDIPQLAGCKHLNRLPYVLAEQHISPGCEGLLWSPHGHAIETLVSNLYVLHQGQLITPPLTHSGVAGTCRAWLLGQHWPIVQRHISRHDLEQADALLLSNALTGFYPVSRYQQQLFQPAAWLPELQARWLACA